MQGRSIESYTQDEIESILSSIPIYKWSAIRAIKWDCEESTFEKINVLVGGCAKWNMGILTIDTRFGTLTCPKDCYIVSDNAGGYYISMPCAFERRKNEIS